MKHLLYIAVGILFSCSASILSNEELLKEHPDAVFGTMTAEYNDQGCPFLFVYEDELNVEHMVRPIQLPDDLKKDSLNVMMEFRASRASNEGCDLANPVIIEWYQIMD